LYTVNGLIHDPIQKDIGRIGVPDFFQISVVFLVRHAEFVLDESVHRRQSKEANVVLPVFW